MNKRVVALIAVVACAIGLMACEEQPDLRNPGGHQGNVLEPDDAGSGPYHPYAVGKKWEYEGATQINIDYPEGYPLADTSWVDSMKTINEVLRETALEGADPIPVWEIRSTTFIADTFSSETYSYVHVDEDSAYFYDALDASEPSYVEPTEPELGDEWEYIDEMSSDTIRYEVVAAAAEANGYAPCLKIKVTPPDVAIYTGFEYFQYLAKEEGLVLQTVNALMIVPLGEDGLMIMTMSSILRLIGNSGIEE